MKIVVGCLYSLLMLQGGFSLIASEIIGGTNITGRYAGFSITDGTKPVKMPCVSPKKKVSVPAEKKNPNHAGRVKVRITDGFSGDAAPGQMVSESEFEKNTRGVRVKKLFFCLNPAGDQNRVLAAFKKQGDANWGKTAQAPNFASSVDKISKIIVDTEADPIKIDFVRKLVKKPTLTATLQLPPNSGDWLIASGDRDFGAGAAQSNRPQENGIAQKGTFSSNSKKVAKIKLYKNENIQIFTRSDKTKSHMTSFTKEQVKAAGNKPIVVVDTNGDVKIMTADEYKKVAAATTTASTPAVASTAQASLPAATKESLAGYTATTLPPHIDIKFLLTSSIPNRYNEGVEKFLNASNRLAVFEKIMERALVKNLQQTPLVKWKIGLYAQNPTNPEVFRLFKEKMNQLKPLYEQVYQSLMSKSDKIDPSLQTSLETLRRDLKEALL